VAIKMKEFTSYSSLQLGPAQRVIWEDIRYTLRPIVWRWYDEHKGQKITTLFKVYTVKISSFGIAEAVLTSVFGART
jgi:hypothetical protein